MRERREIGGYQLVRKIGFGGMSTVYEVIDGAGEHLALKLLHPSISADPNARDRLRREVRTLRHVTGPYVAQVVDAETEDEDAFIVTELIRGPTLSEDVSDGGVYSGSDLASLARELAAALTSIHARGVLHRDLKPSNVMMGERGPVLIDFGIAQIAEDSRLTATGFIAHTPGYCAPEVLNGEDPTEAADWWAWAAVLAYATTGRAPFGTGHSPKVTRKVLSGQADLEGADPVVAYALRRALAPQAHRRPSPDEVIGLLAGEIEVPEEQLHPSEPTRVEPENLGHTLHGPADDPQAAPPAYPPAAGPSYPPSEGLQQAGTEVFAGGWRPGADYIDDGSYRGEAELDYRTEPYHYHPAQQYPPAAPALDYASGGEAAWEGDEVEEVFEVPSWARRPRRRPWFVLVGWVVITLWAGSTPGVAIVFMALGCFIATVIGLAQDGLMWARWDRGGPYRREKLGVVGRLPGQILAAAVRTIAGIGSGLVAGAISLWFLSGAGADVTPVDLIPAAAITGLVSWLYPTSRPARRATRSVLSGIAGTPGLVIIWMIVLIALGAFAIIPIVSGGVPTWAPFPVPVFLR